MADPALPLRTGATFAPPVHVDPRAGTVAVLDVVVPLRGEAGPRVPKLERFTHFALDERTVELLEKLATAVHLCEPCLLEGETSTSKTSSIELLAALTQSPLVRANLSGQTDTSELIGKYVPNDGQLAVTFEALLREAHTLNERSREIVHRAHGEGRPLTLLESRRIAGFEGLPVPDWRWQSGVVPEAMRLGHWLLLDELNLAEPQVLERLNPVIERNPSLTVTEDGGQRIARGGDVELHPGFRVFATMNPASYAGRSPLSPAYKDRFTAYKYLTPPSEQEYAQMLGLMVEGKQPVFVRGGVAFGGQRVAPMYPKLAAVAGLPALLPTLAKLHATLEGMARRRDLGRDLREGYVFSRRTLIELLSYLDRMRLIDRRSGGELGIEEEPKQLVLRAIDYFYLDKLQGEDDLQKVRDQLEALGLAEANFTHDFAPPAPPPPRAAAPRGAPRAERGRDRPQLVENLLGGTILLSSRDELGGYRAGDRLGLREDAPEKLRRDLGASPQLEIIGISSDDAVVVQIDGAKCLKGAPSMVERLFEKR